MWKTIAGKCIYQAPGGARVYQNYVYRWLTLGSDALQTLINRRHSIQPELAYIHQITFAVRAQPADCCLLGLGGAGVAHALQTDLSNFKITAIENNPEVITIASTYFMASQLKNLAIIERDANLFVQDCETRFQHVMIDLYESHAFPAHCNTREFFANCQRLLLPDGILALNLTNIQEQWTLFKLMREIFGQRTVSLPVKGTANMIVLACNSPTIAPLLNLLTNSECLKELKWDTTGGCIARI
jgi:spermidine synthase